METSTAKVISVNTHLRNIEVETDHGDNYFISLPWYQLGLYLVGMSVKIRYVDGDQFALIA